MKRPKQLDLGFPLEPGYEIIFRASKTTKQGRKIYAKWFGLRGFPMLVKVADQD